MSPREEGALQSSCQIWQRRGGNERLVRIGAVLAYRSGNPPTLQPPPFADLLAELRRFFDPVLAALALPENAAGRWNPDKSAWE